MQQVIEQTSDPKGVVRSPWNSLKGVHFHQERIVLAIAVLMFVAFSVALPKFASTGNLLSLLQSVAILGVLGVGMALVIIGRGIDLTMVTLMVISVGWVFDLINEGTDVAFAFGLGLGFALLVGVINGILIAYVEIPAIFATMAMATVVYGLGHSTLVHNDTIFISDDMLLFKQIGAGSIASIPVSIVWAAIAVILASLSLRFTKIGRFIYAMGDNPSAARIAGIPFRPMLVLQYTLSALIAFVAGLLLAATVSSVNTRLANSTMIYDVVLVVVIGGIGLSGGKGGIRNVILGTLLIGILFNGMTILNLTFTEQQIIKSLVLLVAIIVDSLVNPRDEQTAQQGDI